MLSAASEHGRIVQTGLQARSSPGLAAAIAWVRAENLGRIELARALAYAARPSLGVTEENRKVAELVDYDLWCGPAPLVPLRRAPAPRLALGLRERRGPDARLWEVSLALLDKAPTLEEITEHLKH